MIVNNKKMKVNNRRSSGNHERDFIKWKEPGQEAVNWVLAPAHLLQTNSTSSFSKMSGHAKVRQSCLDKSIKCEHVVLCCCFDISLCSAQNFNLCFSVSDKWRGAVWPQSKHLKRKASILHRVNCPPLRWSCPLFEKMLYICRLLMQTVTWIDCLHRSGPCLPDLNILLSYVGSFYNEFSAGAKEIFNKHQCSFREDRKCCTPASTHGGSSWKRHMLPMTE